MKKIRATDRAKIKEKVQGLQKICTAEKGFVLAAILGLAGAILLGCGSVGDAGEKEKETPLQSDNEIYLQLEQRLEALLATVEGVGDVRVMVTMENTGEQVLARNSESAGETDAESKSWKENEEYVVVDGNTVGLKTLSPAVRGVAVVCTGAQSATVRARVSQTVTAVLGISSARVSVVKMENNGG